jgi:hypothetical protein
MLFAVLMMAAGAVVHAYQDSGCSQEHAAHHESSDPGGSGGCGGGSDHSCCHCHCGGVPAVSDTPGLVRREAVAPLPLTSESPVSGPVEEIDQPPRLS